jgi:hypothetical protein
MLVVSVFDPESGTVGGEACATGDYFGPAPAMHMIPIRPSQQALP